MRFSLVAILIAVALLAAACAGMTYRTPAWTAVVVSITVTLYAFMTVRAIALRGEPRAFSMAFAVVGSAYLMLATTTVIKLQEFLITNYPLAWAARALEIELGAPGMNFKNLNNPGGGGGGFFSVRDAAATIGAAVSATAQFGGGTSVSTDSDDFRVSLEDVIRDAMVYDYSPEARQFFLIGHCVWSWIIGLLAGVLSASLFRRTTRNDAKLG